jgi:Ca2+-binding RTX toxin-like protein
MRLKTALLAACVAALIVPAASQAATLGMEGDTLVYRGEGAEGLSLLVTDYQDWESNDTYLRFSDYGADRVLITTALCEDHEFGGIICDRNPNRPIRIEGSEARDDIGIFSASSVPDSTPVTINGHGGNDSIDDAYDSSTGRTFTGGAGDDEINGFGGGDAIDGGDGNDKLDGGEGNDTVRGGAGDDQVDGDGYKTPGSDVIDGGPGYDYVDEWSIPEQLDRQPAVNVTLDGVANDGRPGEGDNVVGVEDFKMYVVGSFTGTDAREKIHIANPGNSGPSTLIGRGGDDELVAHDFNDTVDGGNGADHVEGGLGNDTVTGGPGQDTIYGDATASRCTYYSCKIPFGNDTINARDGEVDNVDCGIGQDTAVVDTIDVVVNCENVDGKVPTGPGGPGGPGGSKLNIALGSAKLRSLGSKGLTVKVPCAAACTVRGTMTADRATARKLGTSKVATGRGKLAKAGTAKVTLKASKKVARKLRRLKKAAVTVKVTVTPKGGAAQTISRKLTLKR